MITLVVKFQLGLFIEELFLSVFYSFYVYSLGRFIIEDPYPPGRIYQRTVISKDEYIVVDPYPPGRIYQRTIISKDEIHRPRSWGSFEIPPL